MDRNSDIQNSTKAAEGKPLSDKSVLLWERYHKPMQAAAATFNAAIANTQNLLGGIILESEGFDPETHVFDADKMRIVPRPPDLKAR
jgi:hypothetical protein